MKICVVTQGCKVNQYESRALEEKLKRQGHELVSFQDKAEVVVVNSCTVTHRSDADARALVRRAQRNQPGVRVVMTGCYAQVNPDEVASLDVDLVVGRSAKHNLDELIESATAGVLVEGDEPSGPLELESVTRFGSKARAFLKVQDGCEAFCAYCIVPFARGGSRSLPPEKVVQGLAKLRAGGHLEAVLTGVHLGYWGRDLLPRREFVELLELAEASGFERLRISSLEPLELTNSVIEKMASSHSLCPHLHIPLQSGSDRILELMGRPYTSAEFRERIELAAARIENLCVGLDVIVGFPGENDGDFNETLMLIEALDVAYLHVFPYSPRQGTRAFSMEGQVDERVKKARGAKLRELGLRKREQFYLAQAGRTFNCLPEGAVRDGVLKVRTPNYVPIVVPFTQSQPDGLVSVRITGVEGGATVGELIKSEAG